MGFGLFSLACAPEKEKHQQTKKYDAKQQFRLLAFGVALDLVGFL